MMGPNNPMCVKKFCWKMEFQGRGAGHIHGTLWCDLQKVKIDKNDTNISSLETAFKAMRQNEEFSLAQEESLIKFADWFTTWTLNVEKAAEHLKMKERK